MKFKVIQECSEKNVEHFTPSYDNEITACCHECGQESRKRHRSIDHEDIESTISLDELIELIREHIKENPDSGFILKPKEKDATS